MKRSSLFAASMAAVSATATVSAASPPSNFTCNCNFKLSLQEAGSSRDHEDSSLQSAASDSSLQSAASTDKFAPRFDGLRFIETLVTAHR
ncbi:hypothetical protein CDL15_Pgr023368 [Punica granatum]|nr:hypothetical protein CDL15_Pgr023368 [Punica granatum]PKI54639.1 hypothetical protein CRG98_024990 [Punica granatum]